MGTYYCLVAGLPELTLDDGKLSYTVENFKAEIYPELSDEDKKLIDLFYLKFDNENLLRLLKNKEALIDPRGNYTADDLITLISIAKEGDVQDKKYPSYFYSFLSAFMQASGEEAFLPENILSAYYYEYAMQSGNKFISSWFEFNLNVNNILTAFSARKFKVEVSPNIVGKTDVSEAIRQSNARDFGLSGSLEYFDQLVRISETHELVERERKIDLLKWNWMEDATFFDYFSIERIFVFLLKIEMIERWILLDKEKGSELFREIIGSLKNDVQIPAEFR